MTTNRHIFKNSLSARIYKVTQRFVRISPYKKIARTLSNCRSMRCEISFTALRIIVCAHEFSLAERNFEEKSPFVKGNYRLICREISRELPSELSSKSHGNKERNSRISLALLLHNTVNRFMQTICYNVYIP